jgi:hypothetical protein
MKDRGELVGVTQSLRLDSLVITYAIAVSEVKAFMAASSKPDVATTPRPTPSRTAGKPVDRGTSARR